MEYNSITQGWFSFRGTRGRCNWFVANLISHLLIVIIIANAFLSIIGIPLAFAMLVPLFWVTFSLLTQRVRHCGANGGFLVLLVILFIMCPIAQIVILFWPGKETTVKPIKKVSKSNNNFVRKEPTLFKT